MLIYIALDVFLSWTFLHLIVEEAGVFDNDYGWW